MNRLLDTLHQIPKAGILMLGLLLVIALGAIDHLSGYEISFSLFYLLPIFFVAWFGKRNHAVIISVTSAGTWLWADLTAGHVYSHPSIPVWNSVMRLGFFLMGVFSLAAIKSLLEREKALARMDSLTGAFNGRAFYEMATIEINRSARYSHPFTLAYIDIDNFKHVNDTLGHSAGDTLLQSVAKTIKDKIRSMDIFARLGGDEFCILFSETNEENARAALTKVHKGLSGIAMNRGWPVTFSIGAVTCYKSCELDDLIKEADRLMYSVKENGKNRIEIRIHEIPSTGAQSCNGR